LPERANLFKSLLVKDSLSAPRTPSLTGGTPLRLGIKKKITLIITTYMSKGIPLKKLLIKLEA
jgi:hypothetical protein